jgi:hypothetical protein
MTKVANLRWDDYDVYIGRGGGKFNGYFGNPFAMIRQTPEERDLVLDKFKKYFYNRVNNDEEFRNRVLELKDKTLGCFCHPKPCHGDIIAQWLDGRDEEMGSGD